MAFLAVGPWQGPSRYSKAGKPVSVNSHIGRRPIAAFSNTDGDLQMLQWASAGKGVHFVFVVHHTDDKREFACDKGTVQALKDAKTNGWVVVDMKKDWKVVFPSSNETGANGRRLFAVTRSI